jgi:hypothetical protein
MNNTVKHNESPKIISKNDLQIAGEKLRTSGPAFNLKEFN